jgi:hypothetical protein
VLHLWRLLRLVEAEAAGMTEVPNMPLAVAHLRTKTMFLLRPEVRTVLLLVLAVLQAHKTLRARLLLLLLVLEQ